MSANKFPALTRRQFLQSAAALTGATMMLDPRSSHAEPPPETKKIRLAHAPAICFAPQYLAEELLRLEGFSEVSYVPQMSGNTFEGINAGDVDITMDSAPAIVYAMDSRPSLVALAGIHAGCFELFGNEKINAISDLKGKTVAIYTIGGADHILVSSMLAYVGVNPTKDIKWISGTRNMDAMRLFVEGKADAFMGFAPNPQELRARNIGHVIVNTALDKPWSQYFCCMLVASPAFVAKNPIATKRVLRAYLKAADICEREPERVARFLATKGYEPRYEVGLEVLKTLPYRRWRDSNPEDTLRFLSLRLHEVGMIKTSPNKLIAQGTDWRFLNAIKKELKV